MQFLSRYALFVIFSYAYSKTDYYSISKMIYNNHAECFNVPNYFTDFKEILNKD